MSFFVVFLVRKCRDSWIVRSVMVVMRKCHNPTYKPPSKLLPNASIQRGGGVIMEFYSIIITSWHCMKIDPHAIHTQKAKKLIC